MKYLLLFFLFGTEANASISVPGIHLPGHAEAISPVVTTRHPLKKAQPARDKSCAPGATDWLAQWPAFRSAPVERRVDSRQAGVACRPECGGGVLDTVIFKGRDFLRRILPGAAVNLN